MKGIEGEEVLAGHVRAGHTASPPARESMGRLGNRNDELIKRAIRASGPGLALGVDRGTSAEELR